MIPSAPAATLRSAASRRIPLIKQRGSRTISPLKKTRATKVKKADKLL